MSSKLGTASHPAARPAYMSCSVERLDLARRSASWRLAVLGRMLAWPLTHVRGRLRDRPGGDVGSEDVLLALSRARRVCAAQVPVPHADLTRAAASHSSWPSMGTL